ncbi:trypsin-like peptidase domain-containing protein [Thalassiella azotivora]
MAADQGRSLHDQLSAMLGRADEALRTGAVAAQPLDLPAYGRYHEAAAVLTRFDPDALVPVGGPPPDDAERAAGVRRLLRDCQRVGDDGWWALDDHVRREVLAQLGSRERLEEALAANPRTSGEDRAAALLAAHLRGSAPPVDELDRAGVAAALELDQWLTGLGVAAVLDLPDPARLRARGALLALLLPFEELAGDTFAGRVEELQRLRDHVGVLPPGSVRGRVQRVAREVLQQNERPLVVHGPGGVGKSALVARFIWEHSTLPDAQRFPFAYLDLDRAELRPDEPLVLLVEVLRQLALQHPERQEFLSRVRRQWRRDLAEAVARQAERTAAAAGTARAVRPLVVAPPPVTAPAELARYVQDLASLLTYLRDPDEPFLLVLDTFEEVQYRGEAAVAVVGRLLQELRTHVPHARVVVSGRAPVDLPGTTVDELPLGDFDDEAASAYLAARGVRPPAQVRALVRRFGRSPLTLFLVAQAWRQGDGNDDLDDVDTRSVLRRRADDEVVQGQLYRRILRHVHDERVRELANPGLVLRRVTPDLIRHVLAGPCEVEVPDDAVARELFDEMARELSLVRPEGGGARRALRHRRDVRRVMIRWLRLKEATRVRLIEDAAIAWYEASDDPVDRAEEIYHRLARRQPTAVVADRWIDGVEAELYPALEDGELEAPERAWLAARLGRPLDAQERRAADQETWERDARRRATELLARGDASAALQALAARQERLPGSPLFVLEATALMTRGRLEEARAVLARGIASLEDHADPDATFDLRVRTALLDVRGRHLDAARRTLRRAAALVDRRSDPLRWLELGLTETAVDRAAAVDLDESGRLADMLDRVDRVSDEDLAAHPLTAVAVAAQLGPHSVPVLQRVLRAVGLDARRGSPLRHLARALARWDAEESRRHGRPPGHLGGPGLPEGDDTLERRWTRYLLDADPVGRGAAVADVLDRAEPPADVVEALTAVYREATDALVAQALGAVDPVAASTAVPVGDVGASHRVENVSGPVTGPVPVVTFGASSGYRDVAVRVDRDLLVSLAAGLREAFRSRRDLARMVRHRLSRSLDSIAPTDDLAEAVGMLVDQSQRQGWTATLLAAGLESRPDSPQLNVVAEQVGLLAARSSGGPGPLWGLRPATAGHDPGTLARLGPLEARVCRVEVRAPGRTATGTGFLVAPDVVVTAHHLLAEVADGAASPDCVGLRFDYKALPDGTTVTAGTVYGLRAHGWLLDSGPGPARQGPDDDDPALDLVVLRVAGSPGTEPIGGDSAEPDAPARGWVPLPAEPPAVVPGSPLTLLHHPTGAELRLDTDPEGLLGATDDGTRLRHRLRTGPGSAGGPCLDGELRLVGVHVARGRRSGTGRATPAHLLRERLVRRGLGDVLPPPDEPPTTEPDTRRML